MNKRGYVIILILIIIFAVNYSWFDSKLEGFLVQGNYETTKVIRVVDGDTVDTDIGKIRLLGINTPETTEKEKYSQEAEEFFTSLVLNKTVGLEYGKDKTDRYGRTLAYLYVKGENINLKMVEEGLANYYFPAGRDTHYGEFRMAWEDCIKENKYLCEKSEDICSECIELKEFNHGALGIVLFNNCNYDCDLTNWGIKDEGRKNFIFSDFVLEKGKEIRIRTGEKEDTSEILYWKGYDYIWTRTGDTLFLRDSEEKLVLWDSY